MTPTPLPASAHTLTGTTAVTTVGDGRETKARTTIRIGDADVAGIMAEIRVTTTGEIMAGVEAVTATAIEYLTPRS